jgi:hypothetical protein
MEFGKFDPATFKQQYEEYARKMDLFMDGPRTTYFEQLQAAGVELPEPDAVDDASVRRKLWEVIAGLAALRVYMDHTNHLSDRDLYARLWHEMLRGETAAIDEVGWQTHLEPDYPDDAGKSLLVFLTHYADDKFRDHWAEKYPEDPMPAHQDPPFNRDDLLPGPPETVADAAPWLRANWGESAFATNRFGSTENALAFVNQLHEAGARYVHIDNEMQLPNHDWTPYADTLLVGIPDDPEKRRALFDVMEHTGRPDQDGDDTALVDGGQQEVRLWWD